MPVPPGPAPAPVVPGYVLEELLGRGGSGQVWRARPRGGGPPVAVKVLVRGDASRQEREAALLGELDHPHLVRLHEIVRHEVRGGPAEVALVLDLLAGGSLAALLARRGRLRPGEVVTVVAPVAAALAHAHDRGVVHGDLSPGNVVFTAEGRPVLTDLGTARLVGDTARAEVTPAYVDPVVARGGAPGPASDVFGVAAAAFHALTGVAPWNAVDPASTLSVAAGGELPDLALLAPEAPEELVRVVRRGLSAEPHQRGSAAEFALDVRHACRPEPVRLPVTGTPDGELGRTDRGPRTELTHQVPGRAPRAAHAAPLPETRRARLRARLAARPTARPRGDRGSEPGRGLGVVVAASRRLSVAAGVLLAIAAGVTGAAWVGASWGGGPGDPVPAADTAQPPRDPAGRTTATGTAPRSGAVPGETAGAPAGSAGGGTGAEPGPSGTAPPAQVDPSVAPADRTDLPADDAGWTAVLADLYTRRAAAFTTADPRVLAGVYAPGAALLDRDSAQVQSLADTHRVLSGFSPQVHQVLSATPGTEGRVVLRLVDELPGYLIVPAAVPAAEPAETSGPTPPQEVAGRGAATVRIVLAPTPRGWRISDASVEP